MIWSWRRRGGGGGGEKEYDILPSSFPKRGGGGSGGGAAMHCHATATVYELARLRRLLSFATFSLDREKLYSYMNSTSGLERYGRVILVVHLILIRVVMMESGVELKRSPTFNRQIVAQHQ